MKTEKATVSKYKVGFKEAFKLIYRYSKIKLFEQIKAVALIIIYLIFFQTAILRIPLLDSSIIAIGLVLVVIGLTFFMEGLLLGLMPLGEVIGIKLPQKAKIVHIMLVAFVLGVGATFAEPAISILRTAGQSVTAWSSPLLFLMLNKYASYLVYSVGIGVGIAIVFGMLRFIYGWSLKPFIYVLVSGLLGLSLYAHFNQNLRFLLGLAWDCGAVTTGPVTVPLVLALGIGISRVAGGEADSGGGFGVVTLASLFPIIAVLLLGIFNLPRVPAPMPMQEFFSTMDNDKVQFLFDNEEEFKAYALRNTAREYYYGLFDNDQIKLNEFILSIYNNTALMEKMFKSKVAFEQWVLDKGTESQKKAIREIQTDVSGYSAASESSSNIDSRDLVKRNVVGALQAIVPLSLFLILVLFVMLREKLPRADEIFLGLFFAVIGMAIFSGGIELGLSKIGDQVGSNLPASFTTIELKSDTKVIKSFELESVRSAVKPDGSQTKFFYVYDNHTFKPVPYIEDNHNTDNELYVYTPTRGPLFGRFNRNFWGLFVVLLFAFIMGYGATLAEPALNALGITVEEVTVGTFKKSLLMQSVAMGVGVGITAGIAKIIWNIPLMWMIGPLYLILVFVTYLSTEEFVNVGWDSAGVTTGPITVPLVLSMGLGIGSQVGVVEGFGILTMASVCPIISVLSVGLVISYRRRAELHEMEEELIIHDADGGAK